MSVEPLSSEAGGEPPLVVDLDGTLVRCDLFIDALTRVLFSRPWQAPRVLAWLLRGRAYAKARLAQEAPFDAAALPYDERVVEWIKQERAGGRRVFLASASGEAAARAVAEHMGLFDDVFASDARTNLTSAAKARRLARVFPEGFAYAGNESADLAVWRAAERAVVVNASGALARRLSRAHTIERVFERSGDPIAAVVRAARPYQWVKNLLVFVPMLIGGGWTTPEVWRTAVVAFSALSFTASSVYLVNDLSDIDSDRSHPRKRRRPFAAGGLSPLVGVAAALVLAPVGLALAASVNVLPHVLAYLVGATCYSFWLKRVVLFDVFLLAALYTIRVIIGGAATGYFASDWLLAFSCFFFFSLALVKRVAETKDKAARGGGVLQGRGYRVEDTNILSIMGVGSGLVAALVLALYLQSDLVAARFSAPAFLWLIPAAEMFWILRMWMNVDRAEMHDDPIVFAARDRMSLAVGLVVLAAFAAALYAPGEVWRFLGLAG